MNFEFPITIYGTLTPYNEVLSKARCRIFYKYGNRNGTYITDEFADILLSTISYAPVKGIYEGNDYTDHGEERDEGRIYGIVPENPNVTWEKHLDDDGVEREYACADVLLFTALYDEAEDIVNKAQSMELFEPSLSYHTDIINGQKYIVFDKGCFLGLQVLGDNTEPCFEGAAFYTLCKDATKIKNILQKLETYANKGGTLQKMPLFKLSHDLLSAALWNCLNQPGEDGYCEIEYSITHVYDEYAIAYCYADKSFERVYYIKNEETEEVSITARKKCYIIDVTEEEYGTLNTLRKLNGDTYELVSDTLLNAQENFEKNAEFSSKIEELNTSLSTLNQEKEELTNNYTEVQSQYAEAQTKIEEITVELNSLKEYKCGVETEQKNAVIHEYSECLSEDILAKYTEQLDNYSVVELDKELAYELKKNGINNYNLQTSNGYIPKDSELAGAEAILQRYIKKD